MKNKSLMTKVITGTVAAGLIFSSSIIALAKSSNTGATHKNGLTQKMDKQEGSKNVMNAATMKTQLDKLVTAGTITTDEETKIIDFINQKDTERKAEMAKIKAMTDAERKAYFEQNKGTAKPDLFKQLVDASIITQAKADAIKAALPSPKHNEKKADGTNFMKAELDKLVTAGTITADEETKITDFMTQKATERKAEMDKVKAMTDTERKAYFEQNKGTAKPDLFKQLVDASIITQAKADAIKAALPTPKHDAKKADGTNFMKTELDKLVTAGTITADEETKITDFMTQKATERKAEMDKVKAMTDTERKAYFEQNKGTAKPDLFKQLVDASIITQAKADAIKAALPTPKHDGFKGTKSNSTTSNQTT
jgi:hypothetical protein